MLLAFGLNSSAITIKEINVNGVKVVIPVMDGFYMVDASFPEIRNMFEYMSTPGREFIGGLIHEDDLIAFFDGGSPKFKQFVHLSTIKIKESEKAEFSDYSFKRMVRILKKQNKGSSVSLKNSINSLFSYRDLKVSEMTDSKIKNKIIGISPVYEFIDKNNAYGSTNVSKREKSIDNKVKKFDRITTSIYLRIKDRLVIAIFYSYKNNSKDIGISMIGANDWLDTLTSINNRKTEPLQGSSLSLFLNSVKGLDWIDTLLKSISTEINNETPYAIDSNTTLDLVKTSFNELIYQYSTIQNLKEISVDYFKNKQSKLAIESYCESPDLEILRNLGVSLSHIYSDANGNFIAKIQVNNSKCKAH